MSLYLKQYVVYQQYARKNIKKKQEKEDYKEIKKIF